MSDFSLIQFFNKMKKWSDMASLNQEFRDKVEKLERNFAVSTVIFKKFEPIFLDIFKSPADEAPRQPRSRKQRYIQNYYINKPMQYTCRSLFDVVVKLLSL